MPSLDHLISRIISRTEILSEWSGRATAWLVLGLAVLIGFDVTMRYLFQAGSVGLQELEWHLFALIFLFGAGYTFKHEGHVRVDIFYHSRYMDSRRRAWVDLLGGLFFLLPFCLLIIISSLPFVISSFSIGESSPDPGGLPYRFLLKAAIPVGFALLLLQGFAHMLRSLQILLGNGESNASLQQSHHNGTQD